MSAAVVWLFGVAGLGVLVVGFVFWIYKEER